MNHGNSEPLCKRRKLLTANMSTNVLLGVWSSERLERITVENVDLEGKVLVFKSQAIRCLPEDYTKDFELSYCGVILENDNTLTSYGVGPGVTIHVLETPKMKPQSSEKKMTELQILQAFRSITSHQEHRVVYQRLTKKEVVDRIMEAVPEIEGDPALLSIIQDPELLMYFSHVETVQKLVKTHPVLCLVAPHIISYLQETQTNVNPNHASTSTGYSYSLDALSDDDDMDSTSAADLQFPLTRNTSFNAITAAQLAAAIAQATNTQFNTNSAGVPTTSAGAPGGNVITSEMFSNAIQQAFASGGTGGAPHAEEETDVAELTVRWQTQLQQMHEMGLINDGVNVRALRATNGDVNAAIELVLSMSSDI